MNNITDLQLEKGKSVSSMITLAIPSNYCL